MRKKVDATNVSRREVFMFKDYIREIDPKAITVIDANEILGEGFKPISEAL